MKSILVFGAGELQESLIMTSKQKGIYTVVIDPDENPYSKGQADKFLVVAGNDFKTTKSVVKEYKIDGIVTSSTDKPLRMMSRIAREFSFKFPSQESIEIVTDKYLMKKCFQKNKIPCADGFLSDDINDLFKLKDYAFPVIIKPTDNSGSRGVILCNNLEELYNNFKIAMKFSNNGKVLVEEYIEGKELSIESLTFGEKTFIIQYTDKIVSPFPFNVEMGHIQPANITKKQKEKIDELVKQTISAIGIDNCACHTELKIRGNEIILIEIGGRLGGDFITSHLTPISTGCNMESALIDISLGFKPDIMSEDKNIAGIEYFNFGEVIFDGKLDYDFGEKEIIRKKLYAKKGEVLGPVTNSLNRHGYFIYKKSLKK